MKLLTMQNAKTIKGESKGYMTGILYLAPHTIGIPEFNICPCSTVACRAACLYTAGRGKFDNVKQARIGRKNWLYNDRKSFVAQLKSDVEELVTTAAEHDMTPCVRLNGTSDLPWYSKKYGQVIQAFPSVQFYDYTKNWKAFNRAPDNYHLTYSYNGRNKLLCQRVLKRGRNVSVVFKTADFPATLWGLDVVSGDETDLRFLDPTPRIVGLKAKGAARKINSPFVLDL